MKNAIRGSIGIVADCGILNPNGAGKGRSSKFTIVITAALRAIARPVARSTIVAGLARKELTNLWVDDTAAIVARTAMKLYNGPAPKAPWKATSKIMVFSKATVKLAYRP